MERPALRRLLDDVEVGLIDVVVVYKIDRLTPEAFWRFAVLFLKLVDGHYQHWNA